MNTYSTVLCRKNKCQSPAAGGQQENQCGWSTCEQGDWMETDIRDVGRSQIIQGLLAHGKDFRLYSKNKRPLDSLEMGE